MKWFHNATIGKFIAVTFAIAIHGLFAAGAYFLGLFLADIIFQENIWLQQGFAFGYAVMVFAGAMWAFVYSEYASEDITAYGNMIGSPKYKWWLHVVMFAVAGSEIASVLFRALSTSSVAGRDVTIAIGLLALLIAFALGKVIHAMANRPFETSILRAREEAGRSIVDNASGYVSKMTVEQKRRFYTGDLSVVDEAMQAEQEREDEKLQVKETKAEEKARKKETKELAKQQKVQRDAHTRQLGQQYTSQLLSDPQPQPVLQYPNFQPAQSNPSGNHLSSQNNGQHANHN